MSIRNSSISNLIVMSNHLKNYSFILSKDGDLQVHRFTIAKGSNIFFYMFNTFSVKFCPLVTVSVTLKLRHSVQMFLDFINLDYISIQTGSIFFFYL